GSLTSQWPSTSPFSSFASGSTRFFSASPCQVSAISAPAAWQALAMPQAIERLLATPSTTPRLPCMREEICAIRSSTNSDLDFLLLQLFLPVHPESVPRVGYLPPTRHQRTTPCLGQ